MAALDRVVTLSQVLGAAGTPAGEATGGGPVPAPTPAAPATPPLDLAEVKKKSPEPVAAKSAPPRSPAPTDPQTAPAPVLRAETAAAEFASGTVAVATLPASLPVAPPDLAESLESSPEPEYRENEPDLDYPADAEDPEAPPSHMAPGPQVARPARPAAEPITVAMQSAPAALPALWPALVAEFSAARPLLGSHLLRSQLIWEEGETPGLRLVFLDRGAWSLIGEDGGFRKSIQSFLAAKAEGGNETAVRFALDPSAAESQSPAPAIYAESDPMKREPIIGFIQELFEGRLL